MTRTLLNLVSSVIAPTIAAAVAIGATFSSSEAFATSNPLIRTCTVNLGTFEVYPLDADDMALCRWNKLVVDSQTLLFSLNGLNSEAASLILSNVTGQTCAAVGATEFVLPTGETMCFFSDDSRLSLAGVTAGLSDPDRLHLKEVLSSR